MFDAEIDTREVEEAWAEAVSEIAAGINRGVERGVEDGAEQARSSHPYQDRSFSLTRSIRGYLERGAVGGAGGVAVGVIEAKAKHAGFVESGTAAHVIAPKRGKAVHFEVGGHDVFVRRVEHPGTQARPFIGPAVQKAERVIEVEVELAVARATEIMER